MFINEAPDRAVHFLVATQSGRGLPQSKTLRGHESVRILRQLLECASPLALWVQAQTMKAAFSLTLTLSRWERGQLLNGTVKFVSHTPESSPSHFETQRAFLPLPAGEGRGEGEYLPSPAGRSFS
jgi:hypothetical protein